MSDITNKQIQFRVWDKKYKQFTEYAEFDVGDLSNGEALMNYILMHPKGSLAAQNADGRLVLLDENRYVAQLFSGIIDSKGVKVFTGDIVKFTRWGAGANHKQLEDYLCDSLKKIVFGLNYGQYPTAGYTAISLHPADLEDGYQLNYMDARNMTVIGNIFENPELLK